MSGRVRAVVALVVVAAGALAWVARGSGEVEDVVPLLEVERQPFVLTVKADGELKSKSTVSVSPRSRSQMTIAWLAPEGSEVAVGDVVVEFESHEARESMRQADAEMRKLEEEINKHGVQVDSRRSDLTAEATRTRISRDKATFKATLDEGIVPQIEIDEARMDLRLAEMDLRRVDRAIEAQRPKDDAALALLEIRLEKAKNQYDLAAANLAATKLEAESPGMVAYKQIWKSGGRGKVAPGDQVWPGRPVVDLVDLSKLEFVAQVREEDAVRVADGQEASVILPAVQGGPLAGTVSQVAKVAQQADQMSGLKTVEVKIDLDAPPEDLRAGLTGASAIAVTTSAEAIAVPREALVVDGDERFIYVDAGGDPERRPVEVELEGDAEVLIASGLEVGERIFARDPTRSKEEIEAERSARQKEARKKRKTSTGGGRTIIMF